MANTFDRVNSYLSELLKDCSLQNIVRKLSPNKSELPVQIPRGESPEAMEQRLASLHLEESDLALIADQYSRTSGHLYARNIENYIGTLRVPLGMIGPLRVNGLFAEGDYLLPFATTEAALVASYNRGARCITEAGGCTSMLLNESVGRAPGFIFDSIIESGAFVVWINDQFEKFSKIVSGTTNHGKLVNMKITIEGNHVYILFEFTTGDASGQNMITIATEQICRYINESSPVKPKASFVEANISGDKKASFQSFLSVRGKKVGAEVILPAQIVQRRLRTTPQELERYWRISGVGGSLSGTLGMQGHYANGLAALYLACGQDVACVAESAIGITRLETTDNGDLYASVNLPNLMVASVGGGTTLPTQQICLKIAGLAGQGKARAFAEVAAAVCLAGELSIMGALCAGDFAKAHNVLARGRKVEK